MLPKIKDIIALINNKVDKVSGKTLTTNDFTNSDKTKLDGIATGANKTVIENVLTSTSSTNALSAAQGKVLKNLIANLTPVILYDTSSGTTGNITGLPESTANFSYLEIYYGSANQAAVYCEKICNPNGKSLRLVHTGSSRIYYKDITINGTSITVDSYKSISIQDGTNTTDNVIYIYKVVGYR